MASRTIAETRAGPVCLQEKSWARPKAISRCKLPPPLPPIGCISQALGRYRHDRRERVLHAMMQFLEQQTLNRSAASFS